MLSHKQDLLLDAQITPQLAHSCVELALDVKGRPRSSVDLVLPKVVSSCDEQDLEELLPARERQEGGNPGGPRSTSAVEGQSPPMVKMRTSVPAKTR